MLVQGQLVAPDGWGAWAGMGGASMWKGKVRDTVCRMGGMEELIGRAGVGV